MTEEEAEEEVEKMKMRAKLLREENQKVSRRSEHDGSKRMKYLNNQQKDAYFGENDLGDRIKRMTHYRTKIHDDDWIILNFLQIFS